ncbi:NAD(P)H-dependent flavin oxidoreductase [Salinicoccus siamensis]|uniref:Probable nitronate monooxygenase n=1 Tax=Salinicoccus siamensis TaxID=381830 RepID=A0ABV5Z2L9_9STAP
MIDTRDNAMLKEMLGIKHAIIQAPMAGGITTAELVAGVSDAGGLGVIGGGSLEAPALSKLIRQVKKKTSHSFGVNLFVPWHFEVTTADMARAFDTLKPVYDKLGIEQQPIAPVAPETVEERFEQQIDAVIEERVPVCSFIFGIPDNHHIERLKEAGIVLLGTATTVREAEAIERAGFDAVVMQGAEAGGHRGSFLQEVEESLNGLISLIPETRDHINIPLIAAGGIMDGRGIAAARILGASGVQLGTAFLSTEESGAHKVHKEALSKDRDTPSVLTRLFTGRAARAVRNRFIQEMTGRDEHVVEYPVHRKLTQPIQDASKKEGSTEYAMLLAGQGKNMARYLPVKSLIAKLVGETETFNIEI